MKYHVKKLALVLGLFTAAPVAAQDVEVARDNVFELAAKFEQRRFEVVDGPTGFAEAPERRRFRVRVTQGVNYVFLMGTDDVRSARFYVYDEWGQLIARDNRRGSRVGVEFFVRYSGFVYVTANFDNTIGNGAWATAICKRPVRRNGEWQIDRDPNQQGDGYRGVDENGDRFKPETNQQQP